MLKQAYALTLWKHVQPFLKSSIRRSRGIFSFQTYSYYIHSIGSWYSSYNKIYLTRSYIVEAPYPNPAASMPLATSANWFAASLTLFGLFPLLRVRNQPRARSCMRRKRSHLLIRVKNFSLASGPALDATKSSYQNE